MGQVVSNNISPSTGNRTGYKVLTPSFGRNTLFAHEDSPVAQRAAFALHNLWATPFKNPNDPRVNRLVNTQTLSRGQLSAPSSASRTATSIACLPILPAPSSSIIASPVPSL